MTSAENPPEGSLEAAALWQLRMALKSTYAQRLQDLQDMIDFNTAAEANNPPLRAAVERLAKPSPTGQRRGNLAQESLKNRS